MDLLTLYGAGYPPVSSSSTPLASGTVHKHRQDGAGGDFLDNFTLDDIV